MIQIKSGDETAEFQTSTSQNALQDGLITGLTT